MTTPIPPAMLEAATQIAFEIRGFSVKQLERAPSIYRQHWEECNRQAIAILEVAGIARLQAAADALPGLVAPLESALELLEEFLEDYDWEYAEAGKADYCTETRSKARAALVAVKGGVL